MARPLNRLAHKQVKALKEPGWYADGGGLYLRIQSGGSKSWVMVSTKGGTRVEKGIGSAAELSLAEARFIRDNPKGAVADVDVPTFKAFAETLVGTFEIRTERGQKAIIAEDATAGSLESGWKNEKHRRQWRNSLRDHAGSLLSMRVDAITTDDVVGVLRPIWTKKPETATRVRARIERILAAAKVSGFIASPWENPAMWNNHLDQLLPKPKKLVRGHHAAIDYHELPRFMADLRTRPATAARALEFLILGANRTGEVLGATREEVDRDAALWLVPAERMKAGKAHTVVLTGRMLEILDEMAMLPGDEDAFIFPGQKAGRPLSNMSMEMLLRRMDLDDVTVHGFRSAFKDWASNETEFADEISEEALAHTIGSKVRQAYRRGEALEKRRRLMEAWEAFCLSKVEAA